METTLVGSNKLLIWEYWKAYGPIATTEEEMVTFAREEHAGRQK